MPIIGSGGVLPGVSYLLGWGFIAAFSGAFLIWRTVYNVLFCSKKIKTMREIIHGTMACFMILTSASFFITSRILHDDNPSFDLIKGLVVIFIILNFFIPLLIFSILSLFLNYWIGISTDIRMNGKIFNNKTLVLYIVLTSPLGIIALLNIIALNRLFDFKVTESIYLLAFYAPNALSLLLSIILTTSILVLLNNTRKVESTNKSNTIFLLLKYLFVSIVIMLFSLLNIADKTRYHFVLPYEFHLVFLVIICDLIAFLINNDLEFLDPVIDYIDKHIYHIKRDNDDNQVSLGSIRSSQRSKKRGDSINSKLDLENGANDPNKELNNNEINSLSISNNNLNNSVNKNTISNNNSNSSNNHDNITTEE
ncbi:hypothetical protein DICPUDRAFT_89867 [Dictyostelium purpureum]|uniref:Uncharacterized protein n=1 Tax=Dictyostelium purpureum TaxID=5786 RepID=F0ZYQ4_DICPU|nr:uncharacterized protein DICPUDRAFT_89867 [Dictyostelium purpureum]EGC30927.1 hypothetical protein DICPUDRAFT_89867 [Dictyostelium purpureum]|eukprot:XP_003292556.1 hypothetical protein DICPUDRAFT_89867 [Dictyostelium purpureum]